MQKLCWKAQEDRNVLKRDVEKERMYNVTTTYWYVLRFLKGDKNQVEAKGRIVGLGKKVESDG
jgi:hypothetical protein